MPTCVRCKSEKAADQFYTSDRSCKVCRRALVRANRRRRVEHYREYDTIRNRTSKRVLMSMAKTRRNRARGLGDAHKAVARAINSGELVRPEACDRCRKPCRPDAHHDDHDRPLDVMWLCPVCHAARHLEIGRIHTGDRRPMPF